MKDISTILVTGGTGLVGQAIKEQKNKLYGSSIFIFLSSKDCDLRIYEQTEQIISHYKPDAIIHLAAQVGGLFKNMNNKVQMFEDNIIMNYNILKASHNNNIQRVISILSTCIFPDKIQYPINESMLHNGPPNYSNDGYAYAKRMLEVQSKMYQENFNRDYICVIPTNIYGPHDNYSLEDGHVIPALIHQCYLSKIQNKKFIVKGSGKPLRQFIYSYDLADLILWVLFNYSKRDNIILSVGKEDEASIETVANLIAREMKYENIEFDTNFSDGQFKKTVDNSLLKSILPYYSFTPIEEGISLSVKWFIDNFPNLRK